MLHKLLFVSWAPQLEWALDLFHVVPMSLVREAGGNYSMRMKRLRALVSVFLCVSLGLLRPAEAFCLAAVKAPGATVSAVPVISAAVPSAVQFQAPLRGVPSLSAPVSALPLPAAPLPRGAAFTAEPKNALTRATAGQAEVLRALSHPDANDETSRAAGGLLFEGSAPVGGGDDSVLSGVGEPVGPGQGARLAPHGGSLKGKTLLYVVSRLGGRDYLYDRMIELSKEYGFEMLVLGYPDQKDHALSRGVKAENYIAADIGNHSPENLQAIVERIRDLSRSRRIDAVKTFLNAFAQLEAELAKELGVPGHAPEAVSAAHSKIQAREKMNAYPDAGLHLPAFQVRSPEQAREAFLKIRAAGFDKSVAKPNSGGGGWGVTLDIDSPDAAEAAFRAIQEKIEAIVSEDPRKAQGKQLDTKPAVLFEAQIPDGLMVDVEIVVREGHPVFTSVSYNPPALGNQERGTSYGLRLPPEMEELARGQALKSLDAVGLKNGNAHVESILTLIGGKLAAPIVEINARMGGADIWASLLKSYGVDVMREGLLTAFSVDSRPAISVEPVLLQHRFLIAKSAGTLISVNGLPKQEGDVFLSELFSAPGAKIGANDLIGNVTVVGRDEASARDALFDILKAVEIEIEAPDGKRVVQNGLFGHDSTEGRTLAEDWIDRFDFQRAGWLDRLRMLPRSFHRGFVPGWTLNAMSQEIQAVALPLFTAALFGLSAGSMIQGIGYAMRVAGAWTGSAFMARFNPKWVNVAALFALALSGAPIPIAAALGAQSSVIFGLFMVNAVVGGLVYGVNRGVAENLLPRMMIGNQNSPKLELALNYAYQWVEITCIVMALFVAVPLLNLLGGPAMMVISSLGIAASTALNATLKFKEPWKKPAAESARASAPSSGEVLPWGDYLPYAFFRFMHFMVYGVLATVLALSVFSQPSAAGTMIGLYDGGSWLASLLATLALLPEKALGRKGWTVLGALSAAAFVWSTVLQLPILTFALGGVLGGLITINSNKWTTYYSEKLSQDKYRNLSKWMMTASIAAMLPIFLAVSSTSLFPAVGAVITMPAILMGINVAVSALAALVIALVLRSPRK